MLRRKGPQCDVLHMRCIFSNRERKNDRNGKSQIMLPNAGWKFKCLKACKTYKSKALFSQTWPPGLRILENIISFFRILV